MHFLIDADSALYKAACSDETRWYDIVDTGGKVVKSFDYKKEANAYATKDNTLVIVPNKEAGPLKNAIHNLRIYIDEIVHHEHCDSYQLFIGGKGNFRKDISSTYKVHRDPMSKPLHLNALQEYVVKEYGATRCDGEEADDTVSYLCQQDLENNCIVSIDKDLRNTNGWHLNPDTKILDYVTEEEADLNFYRQLLTGDATDGIVGIAGYGAATAKKILPKAQPVAVMCKEVLKHYTTKGYDFEYFVEQGRLLWMLREKGVMWDPPAPDTEPIKQSVVRPQLAKRKPKVFKRPKKKRMEVLPDGF